MEAIGTVGQVFIIFGLGLLILQIVMIAKFFQIAANVKAIKEHQIIGGSLGELRQGIELEKYLGNADKVGEMLIRERVKREKEYRFRYNLGVDTKAVEKIIEYLDSELSQININPDELTERICGKRPNTEKPE